MQNTHREAVIYKVMLLLLPGKLLNQVNQQHKRK
jgi:hypothetical protein